MAGRGDAADVAAPAGADAGLDRGDPRVADGAGDRFDRRPAQQPGALLICGSEAVKPVACGRGASGASGRARRRVGVMRRAVKAGPEARP